MIISQLTKHTIKSEKLGNKNLLLLLLFGFFMLSVVPDVFSQNQEVLEEDNQNNVEDTEQDYEPFSIGAHVKNMHTWHGFVVHPGALFTANLEYNSKNKRY